MGKTQANLHDMAMSRLLVLSLAKVQ